MCELAFRLFFFWGELVKGEHSEFLVFQYCFSMDEVHNNNNFLEFILLWSFRVAPISSTAACIQVQIAGPRLKPLLPFATRGSHLVQHISVVTAFLVSLRALQNSWQPTSKGLRIAKIRGWYDNIKMELEETGRQGVKWINLASNGGQWRALLSVTNFGFVKRNSALWS
jgi:hypothetical protein